MQEGYTTGGNDCVNKVIYCQSNTDEQSWIYSKKLLENFFLLLNWIFQGLAKYTDVFLRHEVDLATFATLTEQDLKEIGITTFGARKKLLLLANSK